MKPYSNPSNCRRGARKQLGKNAKDGVDFLIMRSGGGWRWQQMKKPKPAKARAKAKRPTNGAEPRQAVVAGPWLDQLKDMLTNPDGVTAAQVAKKFDWQEHTARARISTALRGLGYQTERTRELRRGQMVSVYRAVKQLDIGLSRDQLGNRYIRPDTEAA